MATMLTTGLVFARQPAQVAPLLTIPLEDASTTVPLSRLHMPQPMLEATEYVSITVLLEHTPQKSVSPA